MTGSPLPSAENPSAVRSRAIAILADRNLPAPTDRQLRRWVQEGTVPTVSGDEISERWLQQCSEAATLLGRGKERADRVRVVLAVRGYEIDLGTLRADAVSSLLEFGGTTDIGSYDFNDPKAVDHLSELVAKMVYEWSDIRSNQRLMPMVAAINATTISGGDEPDETVQTKCRSLVQNVVSSALGSGVYEPKPLADAIAAMMDLPDDAKAPLAERLQSVLEPGWNRIVETVRRGPIDEILSVAQKLRAMGAGAMAVQMIGGKSAANHPTHADYMCFVSAIYFYLNGRNLPLT